MNEEQASQLYEQQASGLQIAFDHYYKYSFGFVGETESMRVYFSYGGDSNGIYRYEVNNKPKAAPLTLKEVKSIYNFGQIINKQTSQKFEFDSF